jgi:alpha-glucosidase
MNDKTQTPPASNHMKHRWPEGAVIYQIYPRSFQDTNGDGVGDLKGVIQRLGYLQELGVTAIWLSPFYSSPMVDFGYDVSDYREVDPLFGTLDDFKELLKAAHAQDMKVLVDLVANHTSDKHPWFVESRGSRDNPKADWYIWKDPHVDLDTGRRLPPNNWRDALAGGSAWEWDDARQQYYMHSWHRAQPDLNWSNKKVRRAVKDVMRFWLDLGVDGFRADAVDWIAKDPLFRDDSPNPDYSEDEDSPYDALAHDNSRGWPTEYAYLAEMTGVFEEEKYRDKQLFMVAETYQERHNPADAYVAFYGGIDPELAAPFNFEGLYLGWEAGKWRRFLRAFHGGLRNISACAVSSYAFGNHDNPRVVSRLGEEAARSAALLQMTLPGMAIIYYGEEIGMRNPELPEGVMHDAYYKSRDPERTPMQWSADKNAGFSTADRTWLPVAQDYKKLNTEAQMHDPGSFYTLYKKLIQLRKTMPALRYGSFVVLEVHNQDVLCFVRTEKDEHCVVLVNFSDRPVSCVPGVPLRKLLLSSKLKTKLTDLTKSADGHIELLPHEAALFV